MLFFSMLVKPLTISKGHISTAISTKGSGENLALREGKYQEYGES
jgi:hypothetical protein